jgi:hypothetical protein
MGGERDLFGRVFGPRDVLDDFAILEDEPVEECVEQVPASVRVASLPSVANSLLLYRWRCAPEAE